MTHEQAKLVKLVYFSNDPTVTRAPYSYARFWHVDGTPIDFAASPSVNNLKQALALVRRYYPNATVKTLETI